ncbi:MAG: ROK family protein [Enterococcus lemanii]|jgi:beta-glucoside kinase
MKQIKLCFDVGGTYIKYGCFDDRNEWLEKGQMLTDCSDIDRFFQPIIQFIFTLEKKYKIMAIGLSFPGFIDSSSGQATLAGAIIPLHGKNIREELLDRLKRKYPVWVENDANCAALAEMHVGNAQEVDSFVLVTLGTGVGGAIIEGGKLVSGAHFKGGEFGMMVTDFNHSSFKTLHELASTSALIYAYRNEKKIPQEVPVAGEEIFEQLDDPQVQAIVSQWANYIAVLLFNLSVTLDPQKILIGGGVSQNPQLLPLLETALKRNPHWQDFAIPIATCRYYNDSGVIGARHLIQV